MRIFGIGCKHDWTPWKYAERSVHWYYGGDYQYTSPEIVRYRYCRTCNRRKSKIEIKAS